MTGSIGHGSHPVLKNTHGSAQLRFRDGGRLGEICFVADLKKNVLSQRIDRDFKCSNAKPNSIW